MKRIGLAVLAIGLVLPGCAQNKAKSREGSRLDNLEAGFSRFQDQQKARDIEIDLMLRDIAARLDMLAAGKPPAPSSRGKPPRQIAVSPSRRALVAGQVIPYTAYLDQSRTGQAAPASVPAPAQATRPAALSPAGPHAGRSTPAAGQPRTPVPMAQAVQPGPAAGYPAAVPPAAAPALRPGYAPPVVTLDEAQRNVPPAAQTAVKQSVPVGQARRDGRAATPAPAPAAQPVQPQRQPEPVAPAQPSPMVPSLEPAVPAPPALSRTPAPPAQPRPPQGGPASAAPSVGLEEQKLYTEALRQVSANKNEEGRRKFNEFLAKYPSSAKTPEALYWIGESYMGDKSYNQAILSFKEVTTRFPADPKSDEALYRVADAYERLGDKANAVFHLKLLVDEHPGSEFAGKARHKLKQLGQ